MKDDNLNSGSRHSEPRSKFEFKLLPSMTQNVKYVLVILSLLFVITAGYSGILIYRNKHNPTGASLNLISTLTGKKSGSGSKLSGKESPNYQQNTKQSNQYLAKPASPATPSQQIENSQRQVVLDFYTNYFKNKTNNLSQDSVLAKYGTAELAAEYHGAEAGLDPLSCNQDSSVKLLSATILNVEPYEGLTKYSVQFSTKQGLATSAQVLVSGQGSVSLINNVGCLTGI